MRRFASVDLLLALSILGSAGFIAYRLIDAKNKEAGAPTSVSTTLKPPVSAARSTEEIEQDTFIQQYGKVYGLRIQNWASSHWRMDAEKWQKALYRPDIRPSVVSSTKTCGTNAPQLPALFVFTPELRAHFEKNAQETVFDIGDRRCWKVGQAFEVVYVNLASGGNLDKPFLEYAGSATLESLVVLNRATSTPEMLAAFGETKDFMEEFFTGVSDPKANYVLARVSPRTKASKDVPKIIHYYPRTKILSRATIKNELTKPYLILDVRSADEIAAKPLPESLAKNAINTPFQMEGRKPTAPIEFDWAVTLRQIQSANFDVAKLLEITNAQRPETVIFIGATPTDARPLYAIKESLEGGLDNIAWYIDGAEALP